MSGPLGQFVLVLSLPFLSSSHTHTHTVSPSSTSLLFAVFYSLSPLISLLHFLTAVSPSLSLFSSPPRAIPLTAMMTSFSVLREVSLLAGLNGALWWPRYGSQSSQCTACEVVFNKIISLRSPQVVDWIEVFARSCFSAHFNVFCVSLFFWNRAFFFFFACFVHSRRITLTNPWVDVSESRQAAQRSTSSFTPQVSLDFHLLLSPTRIHYPSSFSIQCHTPLYETLRDCI